MKLSPVDHRLASRLHQRQIEVLVRCESAADAVDRVVNRAFGAFVGALAQGQSADASAALRRIMSDGLDTLDDQFRRLAYWSHGQTVSAMAESIPRRWWRLARPELTALPLQEATVPQFGGIKPPSPPVLIGGAAPAPDDPIGRAVDRFIVPTPNALLVDFYSEPVARGERLSGDDWEKLVKQVIIPPPSTERIERALYAHDPAGGTWRERFAGLSRKITNVDQLAGTLITSINQGETIQQAAKRIEPLVGGIKSSARRIARTEGCRVAETMQRDAIDGLGGLLLGTQILAVLDQNTRPEHAARNGKIYYRDRADGSPTMAEMPNLPDAPNCRCWAAPVLRTPKEIESDPAVAAAFRNSEGDSIPDPAGYQQWFERADEGRRKMAVGSARYEAIRSQLGDMRPPEWTDFIDEEGRLLSRAQLSGEDALARAERKRRVDAVIAERTQLAQQIASRGFLLPSAAGP